MFLWPLMAFIFLMPSITLLKVLHKNRKNKVKTIELKDIINKEKQLESIRRFRYLWTKIYIERFIYSNCILHLMPKDFIDLYIMFLSVVILIALYSVKFIGSKVLERKAKR